MSRWLVVSMVAVGCEFGATLQDAGAADGGLHDGGGLDGGGAVDAGSDAGSGSGTTDGGFCSSCLRSADCGAGSLCLGGIQARCGKDCSTSMQCGEGATCVTIGLGKGPRLGMQCLAAATPSCGAFVPLSLDCRDTWASYGSGFFSTVCVGACHRHDAAWTTVGDVRNSADAIRLSVETGQMPVGQTLTEQERLRLFTWLACGAP